MTARETTFLAITAVLLGIALLAYAVTALRTFGRFSADLRPRWDRTPWWAITCAGLGLMCIDLAIPLGTSLWGAFVLAIGLGVGWSREFRVFGDFNRWDRQDHPDLIAEREDAGAAPGTEPKYVYMPDPQDVLRNARITLVCSLISLGGAYGLYQWTRGLKGELGFGGLIFLIPMALLFAMGLYLAAMSGVAFARYAMIRPEDDDEVARQGPDADAVKQLQAHGALPAGQPRQGLCGIALKGLLIGLAALAGGLGLWWTDPPSMVRQFVVMPLTCYGAWQLGMAVWRTWR